MWRLRWRQRSLVSLLMLFAVGRETSGQAIADPPWLRERLERVRYARHLPALAAAVVVDGKVVAASAVGFRRAGSLVPVTRDDPFHLGSVTKPMTATMVGRLVDRELMRWDMTMSEMFPELVPEMQPAYRRVTIAQLLSHSSGMPYQPHTSSHVTDARGRTLTEKRYEYVKAAIIDLPDVPPGTKVVYSGGGIIVASAAERITNTPYETMIRELVFGPLGMRSAGFGCMASPDRLDGPWEHELRGGELIVMPPRPTERHQTRSPVGRNVHCSVIDLARFETAHIAESQAPPGFLSAATFEALHTRVKPVSFAPGWEIAHVYWAKGVTLNHNGSNGRNYALAHVVPEERFATAVMTNVEGDGVGSACDEINRFLVTRIRRGQFDATPPSEIRAPGPKPPTADVLLDALTPTRATTGFGKVGTGKTAAGKPFELDGTHYRTGLGVHAPSEVEYDLAPEFRRFVALVGVDDAQYGHGSIAVEVVLNDRVLHRSPILRGGDAPYPIDVPLPAAAGDGKARQLRLVVTDGGDGHSWDLTDWVEAGFVTDPGN